MLSGACDTPLQPFRHPLMWVAVTTPTSVTPTHWLSVLSHAYERVNYFQHRSTNMVACKNASAHESFETEMKSLQRPVVNTRSQQTTHEVVIHVPEDTLIHSDLEGRGSVRPTKE